MNTNKSAAGGWAFGIDYFRVGGSVVQSGGLYVSPLTRASLTSGIARPRLRQYQCSIIYRRKHLQRHPRSNERYTHAFTLGESLFLVSLTAESPLRLQYVPRYLN